MYNESWVFCAPGKLKRHQRERELVKALSTVVLIQTEVLLFPSNLCCFILKKVKVLFPACTLPWNASLPSHTPPDTQAWTNSPPRSCRGRLVYLHVPADFLTEWQESALLHLVTLFGWCTGLALAKRAFWILS